MLLFLESPISVEKEYKGDEFTSGDLVLCNQKSYAATGLSTFEIYKRKLNNESHSIQDVSKSN